MLTRVRAQRVVIESMILAVVLPSVAGAVNATGFLIVGAYTSHVTGNFARFGDELAQGRADTASSAAALVGSFLFGAIASAVMVESARRLSKARYVTALLVETFGLALFGALSMTHLPYPPGYRLLLTSILCFTMGLQNALVTNISGAVVRTTHMTGVLTDIGIELVRGANWLRERARARGSLSLKVLLQAPELRKLRLHLAIVGSFVVGAVGGPTLYLKGGSLTVAIPCLILIALVGFDLALGIHGQGVLDPLAAATRARSGLSTSGDAHLAEAPAEEEPGQRRPE